MKRKTTTRPAWFKEFNKKIVARELATCADSSGKAKTLFGAGAIMGHVFCELDQQREDYSAAHPGAEAVHAFNERRQWLAERIGKAAFMRKADAVEFLGGVLAELKRRKPQRGYDGTDVTWTLFQKNLSAILACRSTRKVADLVEKHLPQERVARWTKDGRIAFHQRVRMFCKRIGFTPSKRGRPSKK